MRLPFQRLSPLFLPCGRALASDFCNFLLPFLRCNDQMLLWLFHFCGLLQRLRYPTPFQIYACKKDSHLCKSFSFISSFLSRLCVAVSLSFARPFAPSKDVLRLSRVTRTDRKPRHMKKDTYICKCLFLYQQLPILPGRFRPSTFGVCELNFRVRHGYG